MIPPIPTPSAHGLSIQVRTLSVPLHFNSHLSRNWRPSISLQFQMERTSLLFSGHWPAYTELQASHPRINSRRNRPPLGPHCRTPGDLIAGVLSRLQFHTEHTSSLPPSAALRPAPFTRTRIFDRH
jgi:hypothetical protein